MNTEELRFVATPEKGEVSSLLMMPGDAKHLLVLGHGASSNMRTPMLQSMAEALAAEGIATFRYNFPYSESGGGRNSQATCTATIRSAVAAANSAAPHLPLLAGGHSFSGRMTSTAASEGPLEGVIGLIFFAFPLHPAGQPSTARAEHLSNVGVPMLFLSGTRDALADLHLLRPVIEELGERATLHLLDTADHSFKVLKRTRNTLEDVFAEMARSVREWAEKPCVELSVRGGLGQNKLMFRVGLGRIIAAFAIVIILLIANAIVSYWSVQTLIANHSAVAHSGEVLELLEQTRSAVLDAETGQRGFLLTGEEHYLVPYTQSASRVGRLIAELRAKTQGNAEHKAAIDDLESISNERLTFLEKNLNIRRTEGLGSIIRSGSLNHGMALMDRLRMKIVEMEENERELLAERTKESQVSGRNAILTLIVSNVLQILLFSLVLVLTVRDFRETRRFSDKLQAERDLLEERVKERTTELRELNTELERSNRELQDFAFVASHDLQEPLRKIQAFGDRLRSVQGPRLDDRGRDYLDRMSNAAGRMHTLINDLLSFSRVTTKARPFEETDLNRVVEDVLSDLEERIADTGGKVISGRLPVVDADPLQMRQLFQNLIANALKFHRPGVAPYVRITAEPFDGNGASPVCRISVSDNGIGFDVKYLDRIFTPFQRLHGRGEYEGTGIGLAVCRKIAERHGGSLTAESRPGEGSKFLITLPVKQEKEL